MTSCAATTTIREALELNGYPDEDTQPCPVAAVAALEQLVEAAQALEKGGRTAEFDSVLAPLRAALAAVGPGEETAA